MSMPQVQPQIKTYGDLKRAVQLWSNRDDDEFTEQIPNFINFAEKEVYRTVRIPKFEREIYLPIRNGMAFIPADCVEIKYIYKPSTAQIFRTVSLEDFSQAKRANDWKEGDEVLFTQTKGRLLFWPEINASANANTSGIVPMEDGSEVLFCYYRDTTELADDNESNEILTIAPDIMLYLTLKHACVFVQDDEGANRWHTLAGNATTEIVNQAEQMEFSGSPLRMNRANKGDCRASLQFSYI